MVGDIGADLARLVLMTVHAAIAIAFASLAALALSLALSRHLARLDFLQDAPNERSNHARVTPRSGGFAIFAGFAFGLGALVALLAAGMIRADYLAFFVFALCAFAIGAVDDYLSMGALTKLAAQTLVAVAFVVESGGFPSIDAPMLGQTPLGFTSGVISAVFIVGFMNAYNFMDGANGLAATCGAFALASLAVATAASGDTHWAAPALILALSICGFLPMNFPDGRLFMGDSGSQLVGFCASALAILAAQSGQSGLSAFFLPVAMAPFILDVAFTLAHRHLRGERLGAAHREHLYQLLIGGGASHVFVTAVYLALTAISCAAAMLMLALAPSWRFVAPLLLAAAMAPAAGRVFVRARADGRLARRPSAPSQSMDNQEARAAE
jgi:UDP-GlcNAc:undecaprenyl-phosphate GlcNAc-1-phosphate transferase